MNQPRVMKKVVGSMGDVGVQMRLSFIQWARASLRKGFSGEKNDTRKDTEARLKHQLKGWMLALPSGSVTLAVPSPLEVFHL